MGSPTDHPATRRPLTWRRRRRSALVFVLLVLSLAAVDRVTTRAPARPGRPTTAVRSPGAAVSAIAVYPVPAATTPPTGTRPAPSAGSGTFAYAGTAGPVLGATGGLRSFRVAVEQGVGERAEAFAATVDAVLGDPRGWIAGGVRFQRVAAGLPADFTIYLASEATSASMCAEGGLTTEGFTSCRLPGHVIINLSRWRAAVPGYGAPLAVYRAYAINHEVGHELGLGHEACPGPGAPSPVMQQQTYGLMGCVANAWPYLDGHRYAGGPVP